MRSYSRGIFPGGYTGGALAVKSAKLPQMLEKVFAILALLLFTGAFLTLLSGKYSANPENNFLAQGSYVGVYGITCLLIVMQFRRFIYLSTREPLLLLLIGVALISVLWSVAPQVTLRSSFALIGTTLFGAYLAVRFSLREQLQLLAWALGIAALFSLAFAFALPEYGVMNDARGEAWRGIYHHKNVLGRLMSLSTAVFFFLALGGRRHRWLTWCGFCLSLGLLLLSGAKTALVVLLTVLILLPLYRALREAYTIIVPILITCVFAVGGGLVWLSSNLDSTFGVLGRDATLTGRTDIWSAVVGMIAERPWLGYGYSAFWLGWEGESAQVWIRLSAFTANLYPTHSHNGMLDLWLDLGFVGGVLFTLVFLLTFGRALRLIRSTKTMEGVWPLAYMTFMLLNGVTYPIGLEKNNIWWVLYVAIVITLAAQFGRIGKNQLYKRDLVYDRRYWSNDS